MIISFTSKWTEFIVKELLFAYRNSTKYTRVSSSEDEQTNNMQLVCKIE